MSQISCRILGLCSPPVVTVKISYIIKQIDMLLNENNKEEGSSYFPRSCTFGNFPVPLFEQKVFTACY